MSLPLAGRANIRHDAPDEPLFPKKYDLNEYNSVAGKARGGYRTSETSRVLGLLDWWSATIGFVVPIVIPNLHVHSAGFIASRFSLRHRLERGAHLGFG